MPNHITTPPTMWLMLEPTAPTGAVLLICSVNPRLTDPEELEKYSIEVQPHCSDHYRLLQTARTVMQQAGVHVIVVED